jgi:tetratricopeptide (TPR) repeat protein
VGFNALPIVLVFLLVFLTWQTIYSANRDLVRAKAWKDLARRSLPFGALALMALSLLVVQQYRQGWVMITWMVVSGVLIVAASLVSVPALERRASRAFRQRDYQKAAELYGELADEKPLARNHAFLGAALGASERYEESVEASTKAIKDDPQYGLAYYNRALVLLRIGKKSRATKDLKKALEVDLPRRFRTAARKILEEETA